MPADPNEMANSRVDKVKSCYTVYMGTNSVYYVSVSMDMVLALKLYVSCMIEDSRDGMKLMLMDKVTTTIISMIYTQTEMLQKEVFLFEHIHTEGREPMKHLKAIVFIQPTQANIELLEQELKHPKYESYYLYFSNTICETDLQILAQADEHELVQEVKEFYMEYIAVSSHVFTVNTPNSSLPSQVWSQEGFIQTKAALISVLLSLKKAPALRYQIGSKQCEKLATDLTNIMKRKELFQFKQVSSAYPTLFGVLFIVDIYNCYLQNVRIIWIYILRTLYR